MERTQTQGAWQGIGQWRVLTPRQEQVICAIICDKRPEQMKLDFALWDRGAVAILIEREYGLKPTIRAVGNYLKRWRMTPQKPIKRACEQKPEAVKAWLDEQYPAIEAPTKAGGAEIHWGNETATVNTDVRGCCYAPCGQTPVAYAVDGTRQKLSIIRAGLRLPVANRGLWRYRPGKALDFFKHLLPCLKDEHSGEPVDLSGVNLTHYWLSDQGKQTIKLCNGSDADELKPLADLGSGKAHNPKTALLAEIIARMNGLFEGDLTDNDLLALANHVGGNLVQYPLSALRPRIR